MLPRLPELARDIAEISNGVVAAARAAGRHDLADLLVAAAGRWSEPGTTVAVVGEQGVGKTALVNALIGVQVLPTRDLVSRSTTAVVRAGSEAAVTAHSRTTDVPLQLDPQAIAAWLDAQGPVSERLLSIDVTVEQPRTGPTTTLLDTVPDRRGLLTAQRCDVLLMVSDADSPLTRPELALLEHARGSAGVVVLVLTRVDRYRGWAEIRAADQVLLPGTLVLPVSSTLAAMAQELAGRDDDEADALEEESGIRALRKELGRLAARTRELRLLGLATLALEVGREIAPPLPVVDPAEARAEADRLQEQIEGLRRRAPEVSVALGDEIGRLRETLLVEVRRAATKAVAERETARAHTKDLDEAGEVTALLEVLDVARWELEESLRGRTASLQEWLLRALEGSNDTGAPFDPLRPQAAPTPAESRDGSLRLRFGAALLTGGSGVVLLASLFVPGLSNELRPTLMSFGMLSGGVSTFATLRHSGAQRTDSVRKAAARALVDEWQAVTGAALRSDVQAAQRRTEAALRQAVTDRLADLAARLTEMRAVAGGELGTTEAGDTRSLRGHLLRAEELVRLMGEIA